MDKQSLTLSIVAGCCAGLGGLCYLLLKDRNVMQEQLSALRVDVQAVASAKATSQAPKQLHSDGNIPKENMRNVLDQGQDAPTGKGLEARTWREAYDEAAYKVKDLELQLKEEKRQSAAWRERYDKASVRLARLESSAYSPGSSPHKDYSLHTYIPAHA